ASSLIPNWPPVLPRSVDRAVIFTQSGEPTGNATETGSPGLPIRAETLPLLVRTSTHFTGSPMAAGVLVKRSSPDLNGWSISSRSHWPTAYSPALLIQAVVGSPSTIAAVELPGATPPIWVASAAELEAVTVAPVHSPRTGSAPGTA